MWLKEGLLPEDFFDLATKGLSGVATADELKRWHDYKVQLGATIIAKDPAEVLEIGEIVVRMIYFVFFGRTGSKRSHQCAIRNISGQR